MDSLSSEKSKRKKVSVKVLPDGLCLKVRWGTTILEALQEADVRLEGDCGGLGKCGRCKVEVLSEMGFQYEIFSQKDQDQLLEDLAVEYARLFLGPAKHISPHESIHHQRDDGDWGSHWGGSTVEVKKFIESTGLEYKTE